MFLPAIAFAFLSAACKECRSRAAPRPERRHRHHRACEGPCASGHALQAGECSRTSCVR